MKMRYWLILVASTFFVSTLFADNVFSWKDTKGVVHYGDTPPEQSNAKAVTLPELTIVKDFGKLYKPMLIERERGGEKKEMMKNPYAFFRILAPRNKQAIRANDGDVTVMLSVKPKLLPNHILSVFLDGKKMAEGSLRMVNLTNLDRGEHKVYSVVTEKVKRKGEEGAGASNKSATLGRQIAKTSEITFSVIR